MKGKVQVAQAPPTFLQSPCFITNLESITFCEEGWRAGTTNLHPVLRTNLESNTFREEGWRSGATNLPAVFLLHYRPLTHLIFAFRFTHSSLLRLSHTSKFHRLMVKIKTKPTQHSSPTNSTIANDTTINPAETKEAMELTPKERTFHKKISITLPLPPPSSTFASTSTSKKNNKRAIQIQSDIDTKNVLDTLTEHNCAILHNQLSPSQIDRIMPTYNALLNLGSEGQSAIGEKDCSKRSGTRFYNCECQLGPRCTFKGWRGEDDEEEVGDNSGDAKVENGCEIDAVREVIMRGEGDGCITPVWRKVLKELEIDHIARVEMVTSHSGSRHQDWHVDGDRGLTLIFAMTSIPISLGPTEVSFTSPYTSLIKDAPKVKVNSSGCEESFFAAMPQGSLLMFNCNMRHRGRANLSKVDRPVMVLDCSEQCY